MKKLLFLFAATLLFVSCSDDGSSNIDQGGLVGNWNLTNLEGFIKVSSNVNGESFESKTEYFGKDYDFSFSLTESPNKYNTNGSFTLVTINNDGQRTEFNSERAGNLISGEWKIEDNKLIFTNDSNSQSTGFFIDSLEDNKLVIREEINTEQSSNEGTASYNSKLVMVLEK